MSGEDESIWIKSGHPDGRVSLGIRLPRSEFADMLRAAQWRHLMEQSLRMGDDAYRNLQLAMTRLRDLRYDEDDEERLVAIEARAFRLLATLRRLSAQLDCAKCYHEVDPNHSGWKANFD